MRTYKLTIAYDGTRYQGWQRQPDTELTVQGTLERTLSLIHISEPTRPEP